MAKNASPPPAQLSDLDFEDVDQLDLAGPIAA
jgi:hypothetical protein